MRREESREEWWDGEVYITSWRAGLTPRGKEATTLPAVSWPILAFVQSERRKVRYLPRQPQLPGCLSSDRLKAERKVHHVYLGQGSGMPCLQVPVKSRDAPLPLPLFIPSVCSCQLVHVSPGACIASRACPSVALAQFHTIWARTLRVYHVN